MRTTRAAAVMTAALGVLTAVTIQATPASAGAPATSALSRKGFEPPGPVSPPPPAPVPWVPPNATPVCPTPYAWGNGVTNAFAGDVNGDGRWDIGVTGTAGQSDRNWYIRYNNGKGSFTSETKYYWGNGLTNVFAGDFDGDGKWDIGVTGTAAQHDGTWYIRYGDGMGGFGRQTAYWWGNGLTNVFTGDFDGDGKWDIGVAGSPAQPNPTWYIRYGDGKGGFGRQTAWTWNLTPAQIFTVDANGDGKWDIGAVPSPGSSSWTLALGDGTGRFPNVYPMTVVSAGHTLLGGRFSGSRGWDVVSTGSADQTLRTWTFHCF